LLLGAFALTALGSLFGASASVDAISPRVSGTPFLRVWNPDDYGASPGNRAILQHPRSGYIYIANGSGVLEFDGVRWRTLSIPGGRAAQQLAIDPRGRVWFTSDDQIGFLAPDANGELQASSALPRLAAGEPALFPLGACAADTTGFYVVAGERIVLFPVDDGPAVVIRPDAGVIHPQLWMQEGRLHFRSRKGVHQLTPEGVREVPGLRTFAFAAQRDSTGAWLMASRDGLRRWRDGAYVKLGPGPGSHVNPFEGDYALNAAFLPDGRIAFGMTRQGVILVDETGRNLQVIDRSRGLPSNRVESLHVDNEGGLWLAFRNGLARLQLESPYARHGVGQRRIDSVPHALALHGGDLFVGGGESLARRDRAGNFHPIENLQFLVRSIVSHREHLFVTGPELRLVGADDTASRLDVMAFGLVPLTSAPGYFIHGSPDGLALDRFDGSRWETVARCGGISGAVSVLAEFPAGVVWAAHQTSGLWRVDLRGADLVNAGVTLTAPLRNYTPRDGLPQGLTQYNITILPHSDGLWAIAAGELLRFDAAADRFLPETRIAGLPTNGNRGPLLRAIAPATDGSFWLQRVEPSLALLHAVRTGPGAWRVEAPPGPPLARVRANALLVDAPRRTLWIAAPGALLSRDLAWQPARAAPALVPAIRRIESATGSSLWNEHHAPGTPLTLAPEHRAVRITFSAPSFSADFQGKPRLEFRTRLVGLEETFTPWSTEPQRDFTNLPYRNFVFEVQAQDSSGRVSQITALPFALAPPWWLTSPAMAGYTAFSVLFLVGIVRWRTHTLRRRAERLEAVIATRTEELRHSNAELARLHAIERDEKLAARLGEEKARLEVLRYQLNPHFLFNTLTSICAQLPPASQGARATIERLTDFCQLTLGTPPEGENPTLEQEIEMLRAYLDIEQTRWRGLLEVEIDCPPELRAVPIPSLLLLPLVENALKYGLQGAKTLHLRIAAAARDGGLLLEVANSGSWVSPEARGDVPSHGIGLQNLRQRLQRYYPGRHTLVTESADGWVRVRIVLAAR
jgi:signal transduction histidine kinase